MDSLNAWIPNPEACIAKSDSTRHRKIQDYSQSKRVMQISVLCAVVKIISKTVVNVSLNAMKMKKNQK